MIQKTKLKTTLQDIKSKSISKSGMIEKYKLKKKNKQNELTFVLNKKIGESFIKHNMDVHVLTKFLDEEI